MLAGCVFNGSFVHRILTEASFLPKERKIASVTSLSLPCPFFRLLTCAVFFFFFLNKFLLLKLSKDICHPVSNIDGRVVFNL